MDKPSIKVFITKKGLFRAKIKEIYDNHYYEVTIGGISWKAENGRQHEVIILEKCKKLLTKINSNYENITDIN